MHQTFYIDIDEEITSIVDRLRMSKSSEVVIVVPKRAILIQSIVNLKLLKKEADNFKKELTIVTQDKLGKMLIEKAGIEVEQKLDDIEGWEVDESEIFDDRQSGASLDSDVVDGKIKNGKNDFDRIGSDGYYQAEKFAPIERPIVYSEKRNQEIFQGEETEEEERITNKELVTDVGEELKKQQSSFKKNVAKGGAFAPMDMIRNVEIVENVQPQNGLAEKEEKSPSRKFFKQESLGSFQDDGGFDHDIEEEEKIEKAGNFFRNKRPTKSDADEYRSINVGSKVGKYFFLFAVIAVLAILGSAAYLFLPKASIDVFAKSKTQSIEAQIDGNGTVSEVDPVNEIIPAKTVALADEFSKNYETTGAKDSSNQKARGTITIYNEFSTSPQPLVATTRFESADNKVFRLADPVTVPGMEKVGSETKPGAIEADVVADESGAEYNIEPTSFTIPGFKSSGGDKYTKIYAKSFKAMIGGGQGGNQKVKTVSDNDINSAKANALQELKKSIVQKLKDSVGEEYVFLDDAMTIDDATYTSTKSPGDVADNFSVTVRAKISAIVFKEGDIKTIVTDSISKKGEKGAKIPENSISLDYGKADADFKAGTIVVRVHASGNIVPEINLDRIKKDLLGKKEEEIGPYIKSQTADIDKIEVIYWPSFIGGRIPAYESRVDIFLDPSQGSV